MGDGQDRAGSANLARVSAVLGVSIGYLLTGETETGIMHVETADERALLTLYRQLREADRAEFLRSARRMVAHQERLPAVSE